MLYKRGHFTWFYFQRAAVDLDVQPFRRCIAEVFKHTVNSLCDIVRYRLVQFHSAVNHNTAVPEVENFQLLKSSQIGLKIWQKLWGKKEESKLICEELKCTHVYSTLLFSFFRRCDFSHLKRLCSSDEFAAGTWNTVLVESNTQAGLISS